MAWQSWKSGCSYELISDTDYRRTDLRHVYSRNRLPYSLYINYYYVCFIEYLPVDKYLTTHPSHQYFWELAMYQLDYSLCFQGASYYAVAFYSNIEKLKQDRQISTGSNIRRVLKRDNLELSIIHPRKVAYAHRCLKRFFGDSLRENCE